MVGQHQGSGTRQQESQSIAIHPNCGAEAPLGGQQDIRAIGVKNDVQGRGHEGDGDRDAAEPPWSALSTDHSHQRQSDGHRNLRDKHPAAPPSQPGKSDPIHDGRPEKLQAVRKAD